MELKFTRRSLLCAAVPSLAAQVRPAFRKAKPLPSVGEFTRVVDPVTENTIVRLTAPSSPSMLSDARNRCVSSRDRTLIFASSRNGRFAPYQLDLRNGVVRQLADPGQLAPRSLSYDPQEKAVRYLDGKSLFEVSLGHGNLRQLAEGVSWYSGTADGALYLVAGGKLIRKQGTSARVLAEQSVAAWPQPASGGCVFSRSTGPDTQQFYYAAADGVTKPSLLASGKIRNPYWDADGQSILFLRDVAAESGTLIAQIHGKMIAAGSEYAVCPTSQFATFAPNSNASVFVGASRSRAQPNVVLMLRTPCREMTLCEHRATHPADVSPVFSPDNRRIYFESDHEGQPAIYSVNVELLVEPE